MTTAFDEDYRHDDVPPVLPCVAAFVTRERMPDHELMILRPALALPRLPSATVDMDEFPADAVLRTVQSVVGEQPLRLERRLALVRETLPEGIGTILRHAALQTGPNYAATHMRFHLDRGMRVRITEIQEEFARVSFEEYAYARDGLTITTRRAGWLTVDVLASRVEHHLFHVSVDAEATLPSGAVWLPLANASGLLPLHQHWLERARIRLTQ